MIWKVWSTYGHRFLHEDERESCIQCGAVYELSADDPEDPEHGRYHNSAGDDPTHCLGSNITHDTDEQCTIVEDRVPGDRRSVCQDDKENGTCKHRDHNCNCLRCE